MSRKRIPDQSGQAEDIQSPNRINESIEQPLHFVAPRRRVLGVAIGVGVGLPMLSGTGTAQAQAKPPAKSRPQPDDPVVYRFGAKKGQPIKPADVPDGAELLSAVAKDPVSGVLRDASRLNGLNLVRVPEGSLDEQTKPFSVDGIVAYSSVCTHQGCDLTQWLPETTTFKCYCHYSEFDATKMGARSHGPAERNLAILPLKLSKDGEIIVAARFEGKVGFK